MTDNFCMNNINKFLATKGANTRRLYQWYLHQLHDWMDKNQVDPASMDPDLLEMWLDDQENWSPNTRRLAICAARSFYRWWRGDQHPVLKAKLRRVRAAPGRVLSAKQVIQLLASFDPQQERDARDLAICCLMIDTGLREAEICNLELPRLYLDERKLTVLVKGGMWGRAVYSTVTAEHLREWLRWRKEVCKRLDCPDNTVFINTFTGAQLVPNGLRKIFMKISRRCGFTVSPHDLRRTFATLATRAGAPQRVTMAAGRWRDPGVFSRYTEAIEPEDMEKWFPIKAIAEGALS